MLFSLTDILLCVLALSISVFLLMTESLNRIFHNVSCPFPCWVMYCFTGYMMAPAAATVWFASCLFILMELQLKGLLVLFILFLACRIAWFIAFAECIIYDEKGDSSKQ